jgi:hypothetical protein
MLTQCERLRVLLAAGNLLARGLLVREDDPERAAVHMDGRGFRYHSRFWTLTGVVEVDGSKCRLRLQGGDAPRARRRIAEEWITAGAPPSWASTESEAAVMRLLTRPDSAARA